MKEKTCDRLSCLGAAGLKIGRIIAEQDGAKRRLRCINSSDEAADWSLGQIENNDILLNELVYFVLESVTPATPSLI
jgi:hypothetical protein